MYDRLAAECLDRCERLARHSETAGQLTRRFLTPPMVSVHDDLRAWMHAIGMTTRVDHAGNLIGHRSGDRSADRSGAKTLLIGSHLDTIPAAGKYDGMLGVLVAVAMIQAIGQVELPFAIDVIGFSEEEGVRFATPYIGSRAIAGSFDASWLSYVDAQGHSMRQVMESFGLLPDKIGEVAYRSDQVIGFIEAHIEQGPVLARAGLPVAAVDAIAGQSRLKVAFRGEAGHAGTMPMVPRRDALVSAARWIVATSEYARGVDGLRATVGYVHVSPNARNVIPGWVEASVDIRHADDHVRCKAVEALCRQAEGFARADGVVFEITERQEQPAAAMDAGLTEMMRASMRAAGIDPCSMISGAGHDAVAMADRFATAMLFIRQPKGISHHPEEDVQHADVAVAIEVFVHLVERLASSAK